ncbi:ribulose-phosphate 3-epimerase [Candidatus Micrarchaeota archaeon]|nr:ribulose-phosphate 3-epimerase [Candidatus Micrarchaeota archaeon]
MRTEIIPAILVKKREELLHKINLVLPHVNIIQLDIMDNEFVPNKTVGPEELKSLPPANYEFHWMVLRPEEWIVQFPGPYMHLVHVETITDFDILTSAVEKAGGKLGLAINPDTPLEKILPYADKVEEILVMTVRPGFSGQKYMPEMEKKIERLRKLYPDMNIEVDGGINMETIVHAHKAGANYLAAASAIFKQEKIRENINALRGVIHVEEGS